MRAPNNYIPGQIASRGLLLRGPALAALLALLGGGHTLGGLASASEVEPPNMAIIQERNRIAEDVQKRIQSEILDRILGPGKASVFVDMELELTARRQEKLKGGQGIAEKYKEKGAKAQGLNSENFIVPGVPRPKDLSKDDFKGKPEAAQGQSAQQAKLEQEEIFSQRFEIKTFAVTVVHDAALKLTAEKTKELRELIVAAMSQYQLKDNDVKFRAANYHVPKIDWREDLKQPKVYIPLLALAVLVALSLLAFLYLFGPLWSFLRRYTDALVQKPAAEINVESNIEPPEEKGKDEGESSATQESKVEMLVGRKAPEPVPETDEEDAMAKFTPFSYINDENLKRLSYLFLLRREEPWLIAVVLSYLSQEYARGVLTALPVELQSKVAMEALMVRQITREQLKAIDEDIKENVDFVVGGVERLIRMLEQADNQTRMNILESLKNEKPVVYEHVRKSILLFEDIPTFPDREVETFVRLLKTEDMAKALIGAPPEVVDKFFKNMTENAGSLLKETMEYQKSLSPAQIEEERNKIMEKVKTLEKEGKITIRSGDQEGGYRELLAEDGGRGARYGAGGSAAPKIEPPKAQQAVDRSGARQYFDAGTQFYQAGNLDEAVRYFRQALEMDPDLGEAYQYLGNILYQMGRMSEALIYFEKQLERAPDPQLRAWIDGLKAQSGAQGGKS